MKLKSIIYSTESIENINKISCNQADKYYRCYFNFDNLNTPLEFTVDQIDTAITRAKKYPEHFDSPIQTNIFKKWFNKLFNSSHSSDSRRGQTQK